MKKFLKIVSVILLVPIVLLSGAFTFLKFADLNKYKPEIQSLVKKYTNIELNIKGDLDVGISFRPTLEMSDVDVANASDKAKIAHIGNALVQVSILPLLHKEVVIDTVKTDNTEIFYGGNNSLFINDLDMNTEGYSSPINIAFDTTVSGVDIFGNAVVSSFEKLRTNNIKDIDVDATVNALGYKLEFIGNVKDVTEKLSAIGDYNVTYGKNKVSGQISANMADVLPYVELSAKSDSINVADFTAKKQASSNWFISSAEASQPFKLDIPYEYFKMLNADVTFDVKKIIVQKDIVLNNVVGSANIKDGKLRADIKNLDYDKNNLNGYIELKSSKELPYIKLNIKGNELDLTKFSNKKRAANSWFINEAYASELMPNTAIPYEYFKIANADVAVNFKTIKINPDISLYAVNGDVALKNGDLLLKIKNITAGDGKISGNINMNANNKTISTNMSGNGIILQKLYTPLASAQNNSLYIKSGGISTFDINVKSVGSSTDQYLSNMNGQVIAFADKSVLRMKSLDKLQGSLLAQILSAININLNNKELDMSCAVLRADISQGVAKFPKGIVFNSSSFYLVTDGKLNLSNDKLNLTLQPFSGKIKDVNISSLLGNMLNINGTIKNPKIGINQTETAKNVIGIIASGGIYNAGDLMLSADASPCHTALEGTAYASHFKAAKTPTGAISKGYVNTKDNIKNAGKEIKNQAKDLGNQLKGLFK